MITNPACLAAVCFVFGSIAIANGQSEKEAGLPGGLRLASKVEASGPVAWTCAVSGSGDRIAIGLTGGELEIRGLPNLEIIRTLKSSLTVFNAIEFTPDGTGLVVAGVVNSPESPTGGFGRVQSIDMKSGAIKWSRDYLTLLTCLSVAPDGNRIAIGGAEFKKWGETQDSGRILLLDAKTGEVTQQLTSDSRTLVISLRYSANGNDLAAGHDDGGNVSIWDVKKGTEKVLFRKDGAPGSWRIVALRFFDHDRRLVACGECSSGVLAKCPVGGEGIMMIWSLPDHRLTFTNTTTDGAYGELSSSPGNRMIAIKQCHTILDDGKLRSRSTATFWKVPPETEFEAAHEWKRPIIDVARGKNCLVFITGVIDSQLSIDPERKSVIEVWQIKEQ